MRHLFIIFAIAVLAISGCGRKEPPQPVVNDAVPTLTKVTHVVSGNILKITVEISGGSHAIGFQIDRTEIDPYCNCPGFWRRYHEETPLAENFGKPLSQVITLKDLSKEYAFRVRAIDALGRFSDWSKTIRARAEAELFQ
jgi:hypothetical protein